MNISDGVCATLREVSRNEAVHRAMSPYAPDPRPFAAVFQLLQRQKYVKHMVSYMIPIHIPTAYECPHDKVPELPVG